MIESTVECVVITFFVLVFYNTLFEPISKHCGDQPLLIWILGVFILQYTSPMFIFVFGTANNNGCLKNIMYVMIFLIGIGFFIWNILGSYWIIMNTFFGNKCLSGFQIFSLLYINITIYAIYAAVITILSQIVIKYYNTQELSTRLKRIYKSEKVAKNISIPQFINRYQTVIDSTPILDIEKNVMDICCTKLINQTNDQVACGICINDFGVGDKVVRIQCNHIFHPDCIQNWYKVKPTCPFCKKPFREELLRIYLDRCNNTKKEQNA